jgi:GMP synthase PP-ATPase subunit
MWITLKEMGFPEHLIDPLRELYKDQEVTVRTEF